MRVFKYSYFGRWAEHEDLSDQTLLKAVKEINAGLFDAHLGNGLYKKRVARQGQGKRGGYRVLLAFKHDKHTFFLHGFAKNQEENISDEQKEVYLELAKRFWTMNDQEIDVWLNRKKLIEVVYES
jgi:hypothetical protein